MNKRPFSFSQPMTYLIKVTGHLDERLVKWNEPITEVVQGLEQGTPITMLTCTVDQAALHGLLRRLYGLGLPLIAVQIIHEF